MFYSTQILSIKNKTELALLFYISTTNNKSRKLKKKDIENVNIQLTISSLKHPPQPFALRLYSTLIKGLVKIFSLKIKYYESELNLFYKNLTIKKAVKRSRKVKLLNIEKLEPCFSDIDDFFVENIDFFELNADEMFDNFKCDDYILNQSNDHNKSIQNLKNDEKNLKENEHEESNTNYFFSDFHCDNIIFSENYENKNILDQEKQKCEKRKRLEDEVIEINDKRKKIVMIKELPFIKIKNEENEYRNCYILREIDKMIQRDKERKNQKLEEDSVEKERKESTLDFIPQISTSGINENLELFNDFNDFSFNNDSQTNEESDIFNEINLSEFIFNEKISIYNKRKRAECFLKLLEYLSDKKIGVNQDVNYEDITVFTL